MLSTTLEQLTLFRGLNQDQLELVEPLLEACHFDENTLVFEQGKQAEYFYILVEGEVAVRYKPYDGPPITVSRVTAGGVFGWSSALGRGQYSSGAITLSKCDAYRLRGEAMRTLCEKHPDTGVVLLERLAGIIAERLSNSRNQILDMLSKGMEGSGEEG